MATHNQNQALSHAFLTTIWTFQLIVAGPIFVWLGLSAIFNMFYTFDCAYDFITHLCTSLLAAGIFFIVLVQRKLGNNAMKLKLTVKFEVAKALLATGLWIWLMMDAIFGPADHYGYYTMRQTRIIISAISAVLLFILFYPTVMFVIRDEKLGSQEERPADGEEADERAPLL